MHLHEEGIRTDVNKWRKYNIQAHHVFVHLTCEIHHKYLSVRRKVSKAGRDTPLDTLFGFSIKSREWKGLRKANKHRHRQTENREGHKRERRGEK